MAVSNIGYGNALGHYLTGQSTREDERENAYYKQMAMQQQMTNYIQTGYTTTAATTLIYGDAGAMNGWEKAQDRAVYIPKRKAPFDGDNVTWLRGRVEEMRVPLA